MNECPYSAMRPALKRVNALRDDLEVFGNGVYVLKYTPSDTSAMKYTIIIDKCICDGGGGIVGWGLGGGEAGD